MAVQTGRTVSKYADFIIGDSSDVLRSIPVKSIPDLGIDFDEVDVTALQDAIKNMLAGQGNFAMTLVSPFDTSAAAAAGTLSGVHTVIAPLNGLQIPRSFDVQLGVRHAWEAGEPQFGMTKTATSGIIVTAYKPAVSDTGLEASWTIALFGPTAPAWGVAAEAGS